MDTDFSLLDDYLRDDIAGHYKRNLVLMSLAPRYSFWYAGNAPTLERWCIFGHEYAHFLHNFSTVSGLWDFVTHLKLCRFFGNTVGHDGTSHGTAALNANDQQDLARTLVCLRHLRGTVYAFNTDYHRQDVQVRFTDIRHERQVLTFTTQSEPVELESAHVSFQVWTPRTDEEPCTILLGSWHIMEALAHEIERTIVIANHADVALVDHRAKTYPYKFGRLLFEHLSRTTPSPQTLTRVCLMALQSTDPGAAFIDLANAFATRPAGETEDITLQRFAAITVRAFRKSFAAMTHRTLQPEFDLFASRQGLVGRAIATLGAMCQRYVDLRAQDLFFELGLFEQTLDPDSFHALLQSYPPCPIVHEADLDGRPEFFNLSRTALPQDSVDALCAYQAFGQFMLAHLDQDGFRPTARCPASKCVFFGACAARPAIEAPHLCQTQPWGTFRPDDAEACLYAAAVSQARGRTDS